MNVDGGQPVLSEVEALVPLFDSCRQFYERESNVGGEFLLARFNHGHSILFIAQEMSVRVGFAQLYARFSSIYRAC